LNLEESLGVARARRDIGVVSQRELPVDGLDDFVIGLSIDTEDLVVVAHKDFRRII
jgi:hypothetical protein